MTASVLSQARLQIGRRARQFRDVLAKDGYRGIVTRVRLKASDWIRPRNVVWSVFPDDVLAADFSRPPARAVPPIARGQPIVVNWVMEASGPGSGGHTSVCRIVKYLEQHGYVNRVYLYDPFGGDQKYYQSISKNYYGLTCEIGDARAGMKDAHAVVATAWPTAYAAYNARCTGKRFYFVQDYEPFFYPSSSNSMLAENTYRMGFHGITAGRWLGEKLSREFGLTSDHFPFGCDTARYRREPAAKRSGVAFYARAGTPRRAVELGLLALEILAKRCPAVELHLFGKRLQDLPFMFVNHGLVPPTMLNEIYNRCFAGLSLSLTNVSLVPYEMLAAGCIPVVNDAEHNPWCWTTPTSTTLPPHLTRSRRHSVVTMPDFEAASKQGAESVVSASWDDAGAAVDAVFRRTLQA